MVLGTGGNLAITPLLAVAEGCGLVAEVALVRLAQATLGTLGFWLLLALHMRLCAVPMISSLGFAVGLAWIVFVRRQFFWQLLRARIPGIAVRWWQEVWPFQWRIAVSWLSGFFIFQLFTPVLFAYRGPVVAGQMGMSLNISGAVSTIALAWLTTKSPTFGHYAALGRIHDLDALFFRSLRQAVVIACLLAATVFSLVVLVYHGHPGLARRLLAPLPFALLIAATLVQVVVSGEAIYVRAFKEERFLPISITSGLLIGMSTYLMGRAFGATGMLGGYLLVNLTVGLGMGTWVLNRKRRQLAMMVAPCD
jgi:hypothetical protein